MKVGVILAAGVLSLSAQMAQAQTEADAAIEYRQGVYRAMEWNLSRLAAMVQGRVTFDAVEFESRSERLVLLGKIVDEGFADANSVRGETVKTRASYRIWEAPERFNGLMDEMQMRSQALYQAAAEGLARDDLRSMVGRLAQSCKACHDKFRD